MSEVTTVRSITDQLADEERVGFATEDADVVLPEGTEVFEVAGSFFFGSAQRFSEVLSELRSQPRLVILRMRHVMALDSTGLHALEQVHERLRRRGTHLILSGVHAQPMDVLVRAGAYERLGVDNVKATFREAIVRAWELFDEMPPIPAETEPPPSH
jgi:SulP family sulfate permease